VSALLLHARDIADFPVLVPGFERVGIERLPRSSLALRGRKERRR